MTDDCPSLAAQLFGWERRTGVSTCDGCAEDKELPYAWPETEAWFCEECWQDATESDRLRARIAELEAEVALAWKSFEDMQP